MSPTIYLAHSGYDLDSLGENRMWRRQSKFWQRVHPHATAWHSEDEIKSGTDENKHIVFRGRLSMIFKE